MVLASFESPANLPLARELWNEDAADVLWKLDIPTLILIGRKDLQVDATLDGGALERAARGRTTSPLSTRRTPTTSSKRRPAPLPRCWPHRQWLQRRWDSSRPESLAMILDWLYEVLSITRELPIERNIEK